MGRQEAFRLGTEKQKPSIDRKDLGSRLEEMNERLGRNVSSDDQDPQAPPKNAGMAMGLRLASEFVSAIVVGAVIGYGIDWIAGTAPWAMIVFLMFGFASGVMNVIRSANKMQAPLDPGIKDLPDDDDEEDEDRY